MLSRIALVGGLLAAIAHAQVYTAHPIDNPASNVSQNIPFAGNNANWDEARSQVLWTAPFLPGTPALLTGIDLVPNTTYATPYELFEIWLDHTTNSTLSTTFAQNAPNPQLVYSVTNGTVPWTGGTWQTLQFAQPFVYDGVSNLVMEVRKVIDRTLNPPTTAVSHRVLVWPRRSDLPVPIWSYGAYGSGAAQAPTATSLYNTQILARLNWVGVRTVTIDSTRDTTGNSNRSYFHIGATLTVSTQGMPGELYVWAADGAGVSPVGIPVPGFTGTLWMLTPTILSVGILDAGGLGANPLAIPNDPGLIGLILAFQNAVLTPTIHLTSTVDAPIAAY